jgi:glycosyltransferase involved in cell wall biosynthesis
VRIAHFVPFAPHRCGMYETARDMIKAERMAGHEVELCDVGIGKERHVGEIDKRGGCEIVARDYRDVAGFDVFASNGNIPDDFIGQTKAPVVQFMHGRPLSSFRLNQTHEDAKVYDIYLHKAQNPRWRKFVTLWPEHLPFWRVILPDARLASVPYPPCDLDLYGSEGDVHQYEEKHKANAHVLIADLWRPDTDPYEVANGVATLAAERNGFRVHFLACHTPLGPWEHIFRSLRRRGVLGETCGMMLDIVPRYRAADVVLTPHYIATRIVRESLACGCTLVAHRLSPYTDYPCDPERPDTVAAALNRALRDRNQNPDQCRLKAREKAQLFNLQSFAESILPIYEQALGGN